MTNALRQRLRAAIIALTFAASGGLAALGQSVPLVSLSFSMTAKGQGPIIALTGQSTCSIQIDNAGSGLTLVPQATSDKNPSLASQWTTVSGIGGGSISTYGNYVGNVAGTGLTGFSFAVTGLSSGTVSGSMACSASIGSVGAVGAPTPFVFPTSASGIPFVQPTNVPTLNVNPISPSTAFPEYPVIPTPAATSLSLATAGTPGPFFSVPLTNGGRAAGGALCWHKGLTGSSATVYTTVSSDSADAYANWNNMPAQSVAGVTPNSNIYNITVDGLYWVPGFGAQWLNFNTGIAGSGSDAISCQVMPWGYQPQFLDSSGMPYFDLGNQSVNLTVVPGPTDAAHYPYVHPTALPTLSVAVVNPGPTDGNSIPYVHPTALPTISVAVVNPGPTDAASIPYVHPTGIPTFTPNVTPIFQGTSTTYPDLFPDTVFTGSAITTATTTQLLSTTTKKTFIYYAGVQAQATELTATFEFVYSANAACSSANTPFSPGVQTLPTTATNYTSTWGGPVSNNAGGVQPAIFPLVVPANNYICVVSAGTTINFIPVLDYVTN